MKPILPNWLAGALIAGFLFLGAALGGPDEVESAQHSDDSHADAIEAAQVAKGE